MRPVQQSESAPVRDKGGIEINGENIYNIRYADDTTLIADSESKLQDIVDKIVTESGEARIAIEC